MRTISDGTIVIDTLVNSNGLEKGVNGLGNLAKGGIGIFAKGVVAISTAMAVAGVASIKLGSDLNEVKNVVDTTFGKNAGAINTWSKNAATSFGIGELAALQMNGTMGAMLKSMGMTGPETLKMSEGITGLSGDMASFYNLDTKDAFEKIRSGIAGETEPLKELGINMSVANLNAFALAEGLSKPYAQMTQGEQTTLRYNYLMSVTKDAQGDFAKTSGSLANQLRIAQLGVQNLGAAIGAALLPMATGAIKELNGMIGTLKTAFDKNGFTGLAGALGEVFSQLIVDIAAQAPKMIGIALLVIQSFITGLQNNLPAITSAAVQVITSLITAFLTLLPQLLTMGLQIIGNLALGIGQALPTLIPLAIQCIMSLINTIITNLPLILNAGLQIITGLVTGILTALPQLIAMLPTLITSIVSFIVTSLPIIIQTGVTLLLALINGLVTALPQLIAMLPRIINSIINVITTNLPIILQAGITILIALIKGLVKALPQLIAMLPTIINTIVKVLVDNLPMIINAAVKIIIALISGLVQAIPQLIAAVPKIAWAIIKAFASIDWVDIGVDILAGIGKGILAGVGSAVNAAVEAAKKIKNSITGFFDINSPSRVMRDDVGKFIPQGIGLGIDNEMPNLQKDIDKNLAGLTAKMQATVGYETAKTTMMVAAQHNYKVEGTTTANESSKSNNNQTFIAKLIVDGKEFTQTVVAPNQGVLTSWGDGR